MKMNLRKEYNSQTPDFERAAKTLLAFYEKLLTMQGLVNVSKTGTGSRRSNFHCRSRTREQLNKKEGLLPDFAVVFCKMGIELYINFV